MGISIDANEKSAIMKRIHRELKKAIDNGGIQVFFEAIGRADGLGTSGCVLVVVPEGVGTKQAAEFFNNSVAAQVRAIQAAPVRGNSQPYVKKRKRYVNA